MFIKHTNHGIIVIIVYVDDIILTGNDSIGIEHTKFFLKFTFDIKDLGELKYFIGIELVRYSKWLYLYQKKYTLDLLKSTGKFGGKTATTLIQAYPRRKDGKLIDDWPLFENMKQYQRIMGKLIYLTITRPDISFAVNQVSQFMSNPK